MQNPKKFKQAEDWRCAVGEFGKYKAAIARNNHSMEVQELQAKIEQLEKEKQALHNAFVYMDECRKEWHEGYMRLHKQKTEITRLVQGLRNEFNLWSDDGEGSDAIEAQIELLEEALRGECE